MTDTMDSDLLSLPNIPDWKPKLSDKDEKKLISDLDRRFNYCRTSRLSFERQWYINMAFYFGRQNVQGLSSVSGDLLKLYEPAAPTWRVRMVTNKIRPRVRKELSKITQEDVQFYVLPRTSTDEDVAAARSAEHIAEYHFDTLKLRSTKRRVIFWSLLCGSGFFKTYWDPNKILDDGTVGSVVVENVNPFHLYVPSISDESIDDQPYVIHAMTKSPDWVEMTYGKKVNPNTNAVSIESKFLSALGLNGSMPMDQVYIKEIWMRPCTKYPTGAVITWCDSCILSYAEGWPYKHEQYPFQKIDHIQSGRFYADSVIVDLIPLQKEYNRTRSQLVESKNKMAKPQLLAAKGSIDVSKLTSEPGLVISYVPGFPAPTPIPLSNIPSYVTEELERMVRDMDEISAQNEVSRGSAPAGVEAASAIAYLQEENDSILRPTSASLEEAIESMGRQILHLVDQFWTTERTVQVVGDNNTYEAYQFSRESMEGNVNLRVTPGSSSPRSRAAKQAFITELGKMGWIDPAKALKYLDMAETGRMFEELQTDVRQVQRENERMKQGQPLPINEWDTDTIHYREHRNFMMGQEFEMLAPEVQQGFIQHLLMHVQRIQTGTSPEFLGQPLQMQQAPEEQTEPEQGMLPQ